MTTKQFDRLANGAMDEIDAAIWSGDMFHDRDNIANFRDIMERWEKGLKEAEGILDELEKENGVGSHEQ